MTPRQVALRQQAERDREVFFRNLMNEPGRWPRWPWLPLKKSSGDIGLLHADDTEPNVKPRVFLINLFNAPRWFPQPDTPFKEYQSLDAILADGWVVD